MFLNKSWLAVRVRIILASSTVPIRLNQVLTRITWCVQCQSISNTVYLLTKACACSDSRSQSIINQRITSFYRNILRPEKGVVLFIRLSNRILQQGR